MKCLIFCGGFGTRMNSGRPGNLKPLIQVAGKPIIRHIIGIYEYYGIKDFILLGGYRVNDLHDFASSLEDINVTVLYTGEATPTGGRLLQAKELIDEGEDFLLTYGDSLTNFNLYKADSFRKKLCADMLISVYRKKLEYGILQTNDDSLLEKIHEKTFTVKINAGFYILNDSIFGYIHSLEESFEIDILPRLLEGKQHRIACYEVGFWHPMDTPNDQQALEKQILEQPELLFQ